EIFEVIDPETGEVKGEGEDGELVYTSIDARGSVVLRYRTGDFVKGGITYQPCPHCGRHVPRIASDITRLSDVKDLQLSKIKGSLVNLNNFMSILSEIQSVDEWQVELRKKDNDPFEVDEVVVFVCSRSGADEGQLKEEIRKKMLLLTEVSPNEVHFIELAEMVKRLELETANKAKRIVDTRPKD
ncbi:MAG: phenylacetate--CoA ligase family protein, partial [Candidatus Omnitrophica bacterium]|nr:phenylacetate--CoA ligase family protein [Candidatus Omnitrophota bacterium]